MNIHQLSINYIPEQDRLLVRINTSDGEELRLWLTRRLVLGFWPVLNKAVVEHVAPGENAGRMPVADDLSRQMLSDFQRAQTLEKTDFKTPYRVSSASLPLGAAPLLVSEIGMTPMDKGQLRVNFVEKLQGVEGVYPAATSPQELRGFQLVLDPKLVHGMVHLLGQAIHAAQWGVDEASTPRPAASDSAGPPPETDKPKYLN